MHTNRLAQEKSPYLLQHAHNPVDWHPWGPEALEKARNEDKPIFLSIGYSTCHWCHVMERESFESEEIAEVLNRHFVPVKLDREERPDIDRIYMLFVQATTGSGGWPMSVFLTPDLKPFFGGTYFPPDNRYGRPGFKYILEQIAQAWTSDRTKILQSSQDVMEQLRQHAAITSAGWADDGAIDSCFQVFRRTFDSRFGGFGGAPKFPRPVALNFLLRYHHMKGSQEALDMALATLRAMAAGGMNDHLGGGFHRYAVDARWFVPHFEKMLYDQAQLAISYIEAYQLTGDELYANVARDILAYVQRDLADPEGAFYSAEDADSVIDPANPKEKGEGAFYIWAKSEIDQLLGQPAADWFNYRYGVEANGNVQEDPHGEFTGKNILFEAHSLAETAGRFAVAVEELSAALAEARLKLLVERSKRIRPGLDDKILTAWNGLMISAFAKAAQALDEPEYLHAARRAADFLIERMYADDTGVLLRRFRAGEAGIPGFLDDYAFFTQALLDLYETDFDLKLLRLAERLTEKQLELFEDKENGAFFSTAAGSSDLVLRMKDDYDGAEPSGNSIAALNLLRLAQMTNRDDFRESASRTLRVFASRMNSTPVGVPQMIVALMFARSEPKEIIIAGAKGTADTHLMLRALHERFVPNCVLLLVDSSETRAELSKNLPAIASMEQAGGLATAYVCRNYACQLPTNEAGKFVELLK